MRVRSRFPFRRGRHVELSRSSTFVHLFIVEVHHILAEIIQGGLVLETNVEEIDSSGLSYFCLMRYTGLRSLHVDQTMLCDSIFV
jgi:hypothetical protein